MARCRVLVLSGLLAALTLTACAGNAAPVVSITSEEPAARTVSEDSYTTSALPRATNGARAKVVAADFGASGTKTGYLRFEGPASAGQAFRLSMPVLSGDPGSISVSLGADRPWSEDTLNGANAPAIGDRLGSVAVAGGAQAVSLDFTMPRASSAVTIALQRVGPGVTRFSSKESPGGGARLLELSGGSCTLSAKLVPSCGLLFGVAAVPKGAESYYDAILDFEQTVERPMDVAHLYARGQDKVWPTPAMLDMADRGGHNRILFINWKPSGLTWRQVADGRADPYLIQVAQNLRANLTEPFFLSLNAEMEDEVNPAAGSGKQASDYADFFRHTVALLREHGVTNAVTVMNYIGIPKWAELPWFSDLYPGDDVVDWIAQDPYSFGKPPVWLTDYAGMVDRRETGSSWPGFATWASQQFPDKPQMLGEWGVDESSFGENYKATFFSTMASQLDSYPQIKGLFYWNGNQPEVVGNTYVDSNPESLAAFVELVNSPELTAPGDCYLRSAEGCHAG